MRIKRFRARDIPSALAKVKQELGPEAVILSTRELNDPAQLGPVVEVTAGAEYHPEEPAAAPAKPRPDQAARLRAPEDRTPDLEGLGSDLCEIKDLLYNLTLRDGLSEPFRHRRDLVQIYRRLLDEELDPRLARALVENAAAAKNGNPAGLWRRLRGQLAGLLKVHAPFAGLSQNAPRYLALVGPSGVGKTTTLAKLAALASLRGRKKVGLINLDPYRLGAADQLRTYARIMGLPLRIAQDREELIRAVELFERQDLVLIDTSGRGLLREDGMRELAASLENLPGVGVLLVLSAVTKERDLGEAIKRAEGLPVESLIVTKIDETERYGNVISNLVKYRQPVSFLTNGQKVPEDILSATPDRLAQLITPGRREAPVEDQPGGEVI
ncbi:MAG: flagellar biosynthesis protein FlhF [Proteobacteria bacterium]|nr:flagellar biosynthesis protein FlhF [Pseudomonadota bacterium]